MSQLFSLIIAYVLGTAMSCVSLRSRYGFVARHWPRRHPAVLPTKGWWVYLNPGPFNIKGRVFYIPFRCTHAHNDSEHTAIVIMASTASTVAIAMEIIAALGKLASLS